MDYAAVAQRTANVMKHENRELGIVYQEVVDFIRSGDENRVIALIAVVKHLADESPAVARALKNCPDLKVLERTYN